MKKIALLLITLIFVSANPHCPCSGKPCDSGSPCGPCAEEQKKSKLKVPSQTQPLPPLKPQVLSREAKRLLVRIKEKQVEYKKLHDAELKKIQQKHASAKQMLAQELERIEQKNSGEPLKPKPSAAAIVPLAQTAPPHAVQTEPAQVTPINSAPKPSVAAIIAQTVPASIPPTLSISPSDEKTELEWNFIKSISAALTPLITAYPTEKLIPSDPTKSSLDDQLEQMHTIATFLTKLKIRLELLSPESREFIKTASFAGNPIARMLARNILSLQSFFESQLAAYKQVKPQSTLVKELKKLTTGCAKEVDALCKELFNA